MATKGACAAGPRSFAAAGPGRQGAQAAVVASPSMAVFSPAPASVTTQTSMLIHVTSALVQKAGLNAATPELSTTVAPSACGEGQGGGGAWGRGCAGLAGVRLPPQAGAPVRRHGAKGCARLAGVRLPPVQSVTEESAAQHSAAQRSPRRCIR